MFNSLCTKAYKTLLIKNFINRKENLYLCIGKPTPWSEDKDLPPSVEEEMIDPIAFIKAKEVKAIGKSPCGSLLINKQEWQEFDVDQIKRDGSGYLQNPTHILVKVEIEPDYYTNSSFRVMGLYRGTEFLDQAEFIHYPPSAVKTLGVLEWIAYTSPITKLNNKTHILNILIEA